jgi:hypothetical protein
MLTSETQVNQLTDEELKALYDQCGGDSSKVAALVGVRIDTPLHVMPFNPRRRQPPANIGNPKLQNRIVSIRHCETPDWPLADTDKIKRARQLYDDGTHEMCQGREGEWFILYLIPRKVRTAPRKYFVMETFQ